MRYFSNRRPPHHYIWSEPGSLSLSPALVYVSWMQPAVGRYLPRRVVATVADRALRLSVYSDPFGRSFYDFAPLYVYAPAAVATALAKIFIHCIESGTILDRLASWVLLNLRSRRVRSRATRRGFKREKLF